MVQQIQIHSWTNFKKYIDDNILSNPSQFLFRGQGNSEWQLESSLDRKFRSYDNKTKAILETSLLDNFRKECEHIDGLDEFLNDEAHKKALAQHYGLPTRLLDWSESPYVAAFFAFQNHFEYSNFSTSTNNKVAIYILNKNAETWEESNGVKIFSVKYIKNKRIRNQAGYFTVTPTLFKTLDDLVDHTKDNVALTKISLPADEAKAAIVDLQMMGIKHSNLFPDLEGIGKAALYKTLMTLK